MGRRRADIVAPEGCGGNTSERRMPSAYHRGVEREATEDAIEAVGRRLLAAAERREAIVLTPQWWQERLLAWATGDPEFRVKLLRFVDVLPTLRSGRAVADHVRQYFRGHAPAFVHLGSGLAAQPAFRPVVSRAVREGVFAMAHRFIAGETPAAAVRRLRALADQGVACTVHLLVHANLLHAQPHPPPPGPPPAPPPSWAGGRSPRPGRPPPPPAAPSSSSPGRGGRLARPASS